MRSHNQSVVMELNRRRITGCISYKPLIVTKCTLVSNKTGGTIKGDIKKNPSPMLLNLSKWNRRLSKYSKIQDAV